MEGMHRALKEGELANNNQIIIIIIIIIIVQVLYINLGCVRK